MNLSYLNDLLLELNEEDSMMIEGGMLPSTGVDTRGGAIQISLRGGGSSSGYAC